MEINKEIEMVKEDEADEPMKLWGLGLITKHEVPIMARTPKEIAEAETCTKKIMQELALKKALEDQQAEDDGIVRRTYRKESQ